MANYNRAKNSSGTEIRIGEVRFSYPKVFAPDPETGKYSCCILIDKGNKEAIDLITKATDVAAQNGAAKYWKGKVPATLKRPLRDGDLEHEDDPAFENCFFFNCSNRYEPVVQVLEDGSRFQATERDFYPGCYGCVTVSFYPYDSNGNRGVGASLGNLIKLRDGERLAGGAESADDSFGDLDD